MSDNISIKFYYEKHVPYSYKSSRFIAHYNAGGTALPVDESVNYLHKRGFNDFTTLGPSYNSLSTPEANLPFRVTETGGYQLLGTFDTSLPNGNLYTASSWSFDFQAKYTEDYSNSKVKKVKAEAFLVDSADSELKVCTWEEVLTATSGAQHYYESHADLDTSAPIQYFETLRIKVYSGWFNDTPE